jgi:hypothetical protein
MKTNNTKNDVNLMTSNQMEKTHKDSEVITTYNTLRGENSIKLNSNMNVKKNDFIKGFQWFKSTISIFVIIINLNS